MDNMAKGPLDLVGWPADCTPNITMLYPSTSEPLSDAEVLKLERELNEVLVVRKRIGEGVNVEIRRGIEEAYEELRNALGMIDLESQFILIIEIVYDREFLAHDDMLTVDNELSNELQDRGIESGGFVTTATCS